MGFVSLVGGPKHAFVFSIRINYSAVKIDFAETGGVSGGPVRGHQHQGPIVGDLLSDCTLMCASVACCLLFKPLKDCLP